jgi:hypothetical protein
MMLTPNECQAKAHELDTIIADGSLTPAMTAQYRMMAASWRELARQAAWQDIFTHGSSP